MRILSVPLRCLLVFGAALAHALAASGDDDAPLPHPLTLDTALEHAAKHNPALQRTREQIREQEGVLVEARSSQLPSLSASGSYSRTEDKLLESPLYEDRNWTISVTARQLLYAGGGTQAKVRGQREQLEAAKLAFTAAFNVTVRQQFFAVLLNRELIGVQEEAMHVLESERTNAQHRREAGTGSDFDVLRAEVAVANARPALIRARNAYRTAQDQLRATLGAPATDSSQPTDLEVKGSLDVPHREIALSDALSAARAHRPELMQQERLIKASEQGIVSARSGYQPTVSVSPVTNGPNRLLLPHRKTLSKAGTPASRAVGQFSMAEPPTLGSSRHARE